MKKAAHLLVGNPTAQSGKNEARIAQAREHLAARGVACDFLATEPEGRTVGAVTAALDKGRHRCVIAMGGDGTFREVAAGLLASGRREEIALGMLPTGTANDQGKSFGLAADAESLEHNLGVVLAGNETRLDAGLLRALDDEGRELASAAFFDSAGWGISARVLARRNRDRKKVGDNEVLRELYRDQVVYAGALLKTFLESYVVDDKFAARLVVDGAAMELDGLTDLIVKNTRIYAGAWIFDRSSRHDDGQLEVVPFRGKRDWISKAIAEHESSPLSTGVLSALGIEHSRPFRAAALSLRFEQPEGGTPLAAQIDGEEFIATPRAEITVRPRALRLIIPAAA